MNFIPNNNFKLIEYYNLKMNDKIYIYCHENDISIKISKPIIDIDKEVYSTFTKISGDWDKKTILEIIKEKGNNDIYDRLQKMISEYDGIGDSCYVTQPIDTYHIIEAAIDAKNNKRVWWHNGNDSRKDVNKFVIFLDNKNYKIIVGIYNGKKENKE